VILSPGAGETAAELVEIVQVPDIRPVGDDDRFILGKV
jgi:hypothetical protein